MTNIDLKGEFLYLSLHFHFHGSNLIKGKDVALISSNGEVRATLNRLIGGVGQWEGEEEGSNNV